MPQNTRFSIPSSVAHSHFDLFAAFVFCLQHFGYLQYTSFICSVLFLFAAYFFFYLQRTFFICSVSFLFAACPLWAIVHLGQILDKKVGRMSFWLEAILMKHSYGMFLLCNKEVLLRLLNSLSIVYLEKVE